MAFLKKDDNVRRENEKKTKENENKEINDRDAEERIKEVNWGRESFKKVKRKKGLTIRRKNERNKD